MHASGIVCTKQTYCEEQRGHASVLDNGDFSASKEIQALQQMPTWHQARFGALMASRGGICGITKFIAENRV